MQTTVDLVGAEKVAVRLSDFPRKIRAEMRPRLVEAGNHTADDMRRRAATSTRIPGAIKVTASFAMGARQGVKVSVDHVRAPHAFVHAQTTTFRHPVFGRDRWVSQQPLNYWVPAIKAGGRETRAQMAEAIRAAAHDR